jgi:hypothetical protein
MDWSATLLLYCADEASDERVQRALTRLGISSETSMHHPPNPADDAIRHQIELTLTASDETELEALVRAQYRPLLVHARSWECEAESAEHYAHFAGRQDEFGEVAVDEFDDADDAPAPRGRLQDFLS